MDFLTICKLFIVKTIIFTYIFFCISLFKKYEKDINDTNNKSYEGGVRRYAYG